MERSGLNENGSYRLTYLKACSLVGGTVLIRIRRCGLLWQEVWPFAGGVPLAKISLSFSFTVGG